MPHHSEKADAALAKVLELFEAGKLPEAVAETVITRLDSDSPSAFWSLGNQLLMLLAGTADARGYRQWQEVGRHVNKGAKAFHILAPCTRKIRETDPETAQERERVIVTGFRTVPVFRFEDTDGHPIRYPDYTPAELPPLYEVAERLGVSVRYGPFTERFKGYYVHGKGEIFLASHDAVTFFHELAHAAHGTFRELKGGQHAGQEIVAETVAATLCQLYGFEGYIAQSAQYVASYAKDKPPAVAAMKVLADVQKVLEIILADAKPAVPSETYLEAA